MKSALRKYSKYPTAITYLLLTLRFVRTFVFGNIYGIGAFTLLLYFLSEALFGVRPLEPGELVVWFHEQNEAMKTGLISASVSIIGFSLAFATALLSWKGQMHAQRRLAAAESMHKAWRDAMNHATQCSIYAGQALDAINSLRSHGVTDETRWKIEYVIGQNRDFLNHRDRLIRARSEIIDIQAQFSDLIASIPLFSELLSLISITIGKIADKTWIRLSYLAGSSNPQIPEIASDKTTSELHELIRIYEKYFEFINGLSGIARSILLQDTTKIHPTAIIPSYRISHIFIKYLRRNEALIKEIEPELFNLQSAHLHMGEK